MGHPKKGRVLVFVRDNGMGIEPSMVDRVFLPFVRLGARNVSGSGSLVSTPGMGSTFYMHLSIISWNPSLLPQVSLRAIVTVSGNGLASDRPHRLAGKEESFE